MMHDLVQFLTESAQDAAARARHATGASHADLCREVEELMELRSRLLARRAAAEQANQLQLPLTMKEAA